MTTPRELLERLLSGERLDRETARGFMDAILAGEVEDVHLAASLGALRTRDESTHELLGFLDSLLAHANRIESDHPVLVDTCGTGGDGLQLFNLSTATAVVVAACGVPVAKHGNRSVSSACGSTDLLEATGVQMLDNMDRLSEGLARFGLVFMHAPYHHPALGKVGPLRRALGVLTTFNLLGPLANPAPLTHQVVGVPRVRVLTSYGDLYAARRMPAIVVHGRMGADEALPGGTFLAHRIEADGTQQRRIEDPRAWGIEEHDIASMRGGDVATNARIFRDLLDGEPAPAIRAAVALNAALVLQRTGAESQPREAARRALAAIDSGDARRLYDDYAAWSRA